MHPTTASTTLTPVSFIPIDGPGPVPDINSSNASPTTKIPGTLLLFLLAFATLWPVVERTLWNMGWPINGTVTDEIYRKYLGVRGDDTGVGSAAAVAKSTGDVRQGGDGQQVVGTGQLDGRDVPRKRLSWDENSACVIDIGNGVTRTENI